jgi:hypothetical protein
MTGVARYFGRTGMMGGAVVELAADGQPSGVISELDNALDLPQLTRDELKKSLKTGIRDLFTTYGVTTMGEILDTIAGMECMDELMVSEASSARISCYLWVPGTMSLKTSCVNPRCE